MNSIVHIYLPIERLMPFAGNFTRLSIADEVKTGLIVVILNDESRGAAPRVTKPKGKK